MDKTSWTTRYRSTLLSERTEPPLRPVSLNLAMSKMSSTSDDNLCGRTEKWTIDWLAYVSAVCAVPRLVRLCRERRMAHGDKLTVRGMGG